MSLFPTQYGNVFGGNSNGGRNELVSFNAGKMTVKPTANGKFLVTPDLKKGKISLTRGDDQLLHFQWIDRQSGASPEDFIIFPDDATFTRAHTGRDHDRVYLLQYKNSSRRFFFWMQHKDGSRDEELAKKVNDYMNNVAPSGGSEGGRGGAGAAQLDHNAIMQMLGAMGAGDQGRGGAGGATNVQVSDLQNILQNMGLPAGQTSGSAGTSAPSSAQTSQSGGAISVAATTASAQDHDVGMEVDDMTEEELLRLAIEESMRDVDGGSTSAAPAPAAPAPAPAAPVPAPVPAPTPAQTAAPGTITAADLQRAMASIQAFAQPKSVSLNKLLRPENIAPLLNDQAVVESLLQHLPEGAQTPHELQETLRSPQLRQSIGSLTSALHSGNFNAVLANFGLDPAAGAAKLAFGDGVGAFLDAIQHWANQQDTNMSDQGSN